MVTGEHFIMYKDTESLCYTRETNVILCVNHNSIKKIPWKKAVTIGPQHTGVLHLPSHQLNDVLYLHE